MKPVATESFVPLLFELLLSKWDYPQLPNGDWTLTGAKVQSARLSEPDHAWDCSHEVAR